MANNDKFQGVIKTSYMDSTPWWPEKKKPPEGAPNVVYVVLDDTGYSQLGCYGSGVPTPNIDSIAGEGIRFNNFHACALCSPTRASLLTGCDNRTVGMGYLSAWDLGYPSLKGNIDAKYGFISEALQQSGYATFCVGKWHLINNTEMGGAGPFDHWPLAKGFDKFYGFLGGATNQFYPELCQDNSIIDPPKAPEDGYHLSADLIDHAIKYISTEKATYPDKPFLCYLALGAMHSPHQAPREYIDKFSGAFDEGYDVYRQKVFERQKEMGLIPEGTELPPADKYVKPWNSLSDWEKKVYARYMEAFAGFLYYTDEQLGRLLDYLRKIGQYENTMIVLISDNGASADGGPNGSLSEQYHTISNDWADIVDEEGYEKIGGPECYCLYPPGWAWAGNAPLKLYKSWVHSGGIKVPCIMRCPKLIQDAGGIRDQYHFVTDIYATVLDVCGIKQPEFIKGVQQEPKHGISMKYTFDDKNAPRQRHVQYYEMVGNRAIWSDGWKAVANHVDSPTFDDDKWELYHVDEDFNEMHNVADKYPEKVKGLVDLWWHEAGKYGALPMVESMLRHINGFQHGKMLKFEPAELKTNFRYYPEMENNAPIPRLRDKCFLISAEADYKKGDEGVLFACGFNVGGYVLYIENDELRFHYNYLGSRYTTVVSAHGLPEGRHEFAVKFETSHINAGVAIMLIDGKESGEPVYFQDTLFTVMSGLGVGRYPLSPIEVVHRTKPNYFVYTNQIEHVDIILDRPIDDTDRLADLEASLSIE